MTEMTYAQIIERFKQKFPSVVVSDYRPAAGIGYAIIVWSEQRAYVMQYQPLLDEFFMIGNVPVQKGVH